MRTAFLAGFLLLWTSILSAQPQTSFKTISIEISNSWTKDKIDAPVVLKIEDSCQRNEYANNHLVICQNK